jgi:lysophospholipase L1-like esterase
MLRPQWVLFGDSITQRGFGAGGWAAALADAYARRVDVVNRGYSGYTTRGALALLDAVFPAVSGGGGGGCAGVDGACAAPGAAFSAAHAAVPPPPPPQLVTLFFGANDAALPDRTSAKQHVPVEE